MIEIIGWIALVLLSFSLFLWLYPAIIASDMYFKHFPKREAAWRLTQYLFRSLLRYPKSVVEGWDFLTNEQLRLNAIDMLDAAFEKVKEDRK